MKERRFRRPHITGEVPSPEVPGEVFVPVPGLKPGDKDAVEKVVSVLMPGGEKSGWFKKTFLNEKGRPNARFYEVMGGAIILVGGAIEHMRHYQDVKELSGKVQESKDKWINERLPKLRNIRNEYDNPHRLKSIKDFVEKARLYSEVHVTAVVHNQRNRDYEGEVLGFAIMYSLPSGDFYPELLRGSVLAESWNNEKARTEDMRKVWAQTEKQRRRLVEVLDEGDDKVKLVAENREVDKILRDEWLELPSWDIFSELDKVMYLDEEPQPEKKTRRFNLFRRGR